MQTDITLLAGRCPARNYTDVSCQAASQGRSGRRGGQPDGMLRSATGTVGPDPLFLAGETRVLEPARERNIDMGRPQRKNPARRRVRGAGRTGEGVTRVVAPKPRRPALE